MKAPYDVYGTWDEGVKYCHDLGMVLANPISNEDWVAMWLAWIKFTEEQIPDRNGFIYHKDLEKQEDLRYSFVLVTVTL